MWSLLYQLVLSLATLVAAPVLLIRRRSHYSSSIRQRLGLTQLPAAGKTAPLWIHAVSVGEVSVAATVAPRLSQLLPLLVTTVTWTGQERARKEFPDARVAYLPFDLGIPVRRFFDHFNPRLLVLTEGDLWPTVLRYARRRSVPIVVINGRVSDRSFRRMARVRPFLSPLLAPVDRFGVQTEADRSRLLALGVSPRKVSVTGNLKFDSPEPPISEELQTLIGRLASGRSVLVAGSTMPGEEEQVLEAFDAIGSGRRGLLVLAPRHPERWQAVADLLSQSGLEWVRRSEIGQQESSTPAVVLLDTLGELAGLYRFASSAFIGGTLTPTGGHNPLEAARFGVPVVVGPSMENFLEIERVFDDARAWERVESSDQLAQCWTQWLDHPSAASELGRRGSELVDSHRGALTRTLDLLEPWLPERKESE
jgi:3-deoxy-D-manno-octulosonic-acid transferase